MRRVLMVAILASITVSSLAAGSQRAVRADAVMPKPFPVFYAVETKNWNEAVAEIVEYDGDPDWYAFPLAAATGGKWLLVWREMIPGGVHLGYGAKPYTSAIEAATIYESLPPDNRRMLNWHDGTILLIWKCGETDEETNTYTRLRDCERPGMP